MRHVLVRCAQRRAHGRLAAAVTSQSSVLTRSSFRNKAGHASLSAIGRISPPCASAAFLSITAGAVGCGVPASVRECPNQHRACPLEKIHPKEGLGDRPADGQRPVIAKQHDVTAAQVALKPRPLIEVERYALIVVIDEVRKNELRRPEVRPRRSVGSLKRYRA